MIVTPVHKKGNKSDPSNYWANSLLSIPGKVLSHILLKRIKLQSEELTKENWYVFHPNRGTVDAIFIVCQIIEKAKEPKVNLILNLLSTQFGEKLFGKCLHTLVSIKNYQYPRKTL